MDLLKALDILGSVSGNDNNNEADAETVRNQRKLKITACRVVTEQISNPLLK